MRDTFYLVLTRSGAKKIRKAPGHLDPSEIEVKIDIEIPDAAFSKPTFSTKLELSEEQIQTFDIEAVDIELNKLKNKEEDPK